MKSRELQEIPDGEMRSIGPFEVTRKRVRDQIDKWVVKSNVPYTVKH